MGMWMSAQYSTIHTTHGKKPSLKPGKEESANKQQTQKKNKKKYIKTNCNSLQQLQRTQLFPLCVGSRGHAL